jgi:hypothetical protein
LSTAFAKVPAEICRNIRESWESDVARECTMRPGSVEARRSRIWGMSLFPYSGESSIAIVRVTIKYKFQNRVAVSNSGEKNNQRTTHAKNYHDG